LKYFVGPLKVFVGSLIILVFSLLGFAAHSDSREDEILQSMEQLLESGVGKLREGLISEAMKRLVSVLAEKQKLARSLPQANEVAQAAQIELAKLQTSLALEADPLWLDESMNQKVGSTLNAEQGPVVILTWRTDTGRSLVFNAPIRFEFLEGSGTLTTIVISSMPLRRTEQPFSFSSDRGAEFRKILIFSPPSSRPSKSLNTIFRCTTAICQRTNLPAFMPEKKIRLRDSVSKRAHPIWLFSSTIVTRFGS